MAPRTQPVLVVERLLDLKSPGYRLTHSIAETRPARGTAPAFGHESNPTQPSAVDLCGWITLTHLELRLTTRVAEVSRRLARGTAPGAG